MNWLTTVDARLSRWAMYLAVACLLGIVGVVVGSVIWRYVLNDAPAWSEQVALLLVHIKNIKICGKHKQKIK